MIEDESTAAPVESVDPRFLPHPDPAYAALGYSAADEGVYVNPAILEAVNGARVDFGTDVVRRQIEEEAERAEAARLAAEAQAAEQLAISERAPEVAPVEDTATPDSL